MFISATGAQPEEKTVFLVWPKSHRAQRRPGSGHRKALHA